MPNRYTEIPQGIAASLRDVSMPVIITEASESAREIQALADRSERRLLSIATGGGWNCRGKVGVNAPVPDEREGGVGLLLDLSQITWFGRQVSILFDSNRDATAAFRGTRWEYAQLLVSLGAQVFFVDVRSDGSAKDLAHFIAIAGDQAMLARLDSALPFAQQVESDAQEAVQNLRKSSSFQVRDAALALIAAIPNISHRRVLGGRAARVLTEQHLSVERTVTSMARAARRASERAKDHMRHQHNLRVKIVPSDLIMEIEDFYGGSGRLILPPGAKTALALFTVNSGSFDLFDTTAYIQIDSALGGCGKTILLLHLEAICSRPFLVTDLTAATLFRRIHRDKPTLLVDEAAGLQGSDERARALRAVLDAGYRKGAVVSRCVGDDHELKDFEVFCPKAFALVGSLRGTTLDRCIALHLVKMKPLSKTRLRVLKRLAPPLRAKLEAYRDQFRSELERLYEAEPDAGYWPQLTGCEEDIWAPLLIHAKLAGPEIEKRALDVALSFSAQKAELAVAEDSDLALTQELHEALEKENSIYFSPGELVPILIEKESWAEKLAKSRTPQGRVCAVGKFLTRFRLPSRERTSEGTRYTREEALSVIAPHLPSPKVTNAAQPVYATVSEAASSQSENGPSADGDVVEHKASASVAVNADPLQLPLQENATPQSRMNTGPVALGNSTQGDTEVLPF